ncbi:MAG: TIGR02757 family protein [Deltaproteobacteria bacterium]|nr:TIGR02757 family protein [Deltaproteobacteria bacterium]
MQKTALKTSLDRHLDDLYLRYNRREFVHPDPLAFLYPYEDVRDREIVGLIASALAYGRVNQIMKSVGLVLERMPSPHAFLRQASLRSLEKTFQGFKHRFTTGEELAALLFGVKRAVERHGSLSSCFRLGLHDEDDTVLEALAAFVDELSTLANRSLSFLLPSPTKGSACKRLHLYLRWMVRRDAVDPGGWKSVDPSKLVVPLDTHMYRIGLALGLTGCKQANIRAALEVTAGFRTIAPNDPVRYDFALTRLGIRTDTDLNAFLKTCGVKGHACL